MKTVNSLDKLKQTVSSFASMSVPVSTNHEPVKRQMLTLTEMTFVYILKLLGVEDEEKLGKIVLQLRKGTLLYDFTFLAHNLAKSKTDFDFLTSPDNVEVYAKIAEVAGGCGIELLPYVNVLSRIAENMQYGLYSENQEIALFLDEYYTHRKNVDIKEFLHQFRKILKYPSQVCLEKLIEDDIFSLIESALYENFERIVNASSLALYVYAMHYCDFNISNEDENFLIFHITQCVVCLEKHDEIKFSTALKEREIPQFDSVEDALDYFFSYYDGEFDSINKFISLLKDVYPSLDTYSFCSFVRDSFVTGNNKAAVYPNGDFFTVMSGFIRSKSKSIPLCKKLSALLPNCILCKRSPSILHHDGVPLCMFFDEHDAFAFYALENGNENKVLPPAHVFVEVKILKLNESGYVERWRWEH